MAKKTHVPKPVSEYWKEKYAGSGKSAGSTGAARNSKSAGTGRKSVTSGKTVHSKPSPAIRKHRKAASPKKKVIRLTVRQIIMIAFSVIGLLMLPFLSRKDSDSGAEVPAGNYRFGIDISHHNPGEPQWDSLKVMIGAGGRTVKSVRAANQILPVTFVFIKATEGTDYKDKMFRRNWREAGKRNYARGAYHFFRSSKNPLAQARNFINTVGDLRHIDLPPVLDVETMHPGCSRKELNDKLLIWLKAVTERYGRKPVVYASERFVTDILSDEITSAYPLWIAHYNVPAPERDDWSYWQFTDRAVVYGIQGYVDLNVVRVR